MYQKLLLLLFVVVLSQTQDESEVDYYTKLITDATKNALNYQWPTNAHKYYSSTKRECFGNYDFVVIGAGAGGSVAASRLSEIKDWSVLVLETGTYGDNMTKIPNMYGPVAFTDYNWAFNTTPQTTCCLGMINKSCLYPRGKGVGGTTLINGLVQARGYKADFDKWAKFAGSDRWGFESVLKYYKKVENFVHNDPTAPYDPEYHGTGGHLRVEYHKPESKQLIAFLEANKELGYKVADYNANKLGVSPTQINTIHGRRLDDATAFLGPAKNRSNLKILTNSYVTKLQVDKNKGVVKGVEFTNNGKNYFVEANKEVILAAGAFGSAQILMLSGIGPKKHLQDLGIDVIADLEVGTTLRDNTVFFGITVGTNYTEPIKPLKEYVKEYLNGVGPYAIPNSNQGIGFYESSYTKGTGYPDIELEFIPANATNDLSQRSLGLSDETYEDVWKHNNAAQSFLIYVCNLHDRSVGSFRLRSKNAFDYPLINSKFLSDPNNEDINVLYEAVQIVLKLLETKAFKAMNATLQGGPLRACKQFEYLTKDYWFCAIRQVSAHLNHPLGTCPMGKDPKAGAVVDAELKVFGFKNLRIADASVFPLTLAGHTNAPIVMVGEQLGDLVQIAHNKKVQ